MFFDFTYVDPDSYIARHARCALRAVEEAYPTFAEWHAATEGDPSTGELSKKDQAKLDRVGRKCKHLLPPGVS